MASGRPHAVSHDWIDRVDPGWCHWFRVMQYVSYQRRLNWTGADILASTQVDNLSLWDVINHSTHYVQTVFCVWDVRCDGWEWTRRTWISTHLLLLGNRLWLLNMRMSMNSTSLSPGQQATCQHREVVMMHLILYFLRLLRNNFFKGLDSEHGLSWTVSQIEVDFWSLVYCVTTLSPEFGGSGSSMSF